MGLKYPYVITMELPKFLCVVITVSLGLLINSKKLEFTGVLLEWECYSMYAMTQV